MISVIVPVYKAEKVIARCIESVIAQEYQDWELILVDDGSPDKSGEICDEYALKDKRIRVVHQENAGASAARNHGMNVARGEYICFIDADDYVTERYLADFMIDKNADADFVVQGISHLYPDNDIMSHEIPNEILGESVKELLNEPSSFGLIHGPCCKLFKSEIILKNHIGFPINLRYSEDGIFVLDYLSKCKGRALLIGSSNYIYCHTEGESLTQIFHTGEELYRSVYSKYLLFCRIISSFSGINDTFIKNYRHHLSIDLYQSIYNTFVDRRLSFLTRIYFLKKIDSQLLHFIQKDKNLPRLFMIFRLFSFLK